MTVTLDLPPEKEAAFKAQAQARGLSLEQWMLELADQSVQPVSIAHLQKINPRSGGGSFAPGLTAMTPGSRFSPTRQ
jgi:hypothetical protein